MKIKFVFDLGS
nr:4.9 kDa non-structural protein [Bovine coronavirus]UVC33094.1 4.9 kDa non-structural protein [Bovine coronavirus]UVC33118.1 4.9 kDa non-structural protein [Bovine coronavirus]UVC33562.1 4.9 kDa non-structural protein [Bovine coronavirus]